MRIVDVSCHGCGKREPVSIRDGSNPLEWHVADGKDLCGSDCLLKYAQAAVEADVRREGYCNSPYISHGGKHPQDSECTDWLSVGECQKGGRIMKEAEIGAWKFEDETSDLGDLAYRVEDADKNGWEAKMFCVNPAGVYVVGYKKVRQHREGEISKSRHKITHTGQFLRFFIAKLRFK